VTGLTELARRWPLSSVGVKGLEGLDVSSFVGDPALLQLYVDRIIERADQSRLTDPRVNEAVRTALGGYPELAPAIPAAFIAQEAT
jgi:hypothetical protein